MKTTQETLQDINRIEKKNATAIQVGGEASDRRQGRTCHRPGTTEANRAQEKYMTQLERQATLLYEERVQ